LENLEKIRCNNGPGPVTSSVGKSSKDPRGSNMWCHYCDKNNHSTGDCREIAQFKQQKKASFESKAGFAKNSLEFLVLFEKINTLKRQLKPEKTASNKNRKAESLISTKTNLTTSIYEGENKEYYLTSSKHFISSKTKLEKSSHPIIHH
jgi:hypothetical protein